jgi:hypothetical protein
MAGRIPARFAVVAVFASAAAVVPSGTAVAHRSGCHSHHVCPSDHATYRWRGLACVKPSAPENDGSYKKRVTYQGLPYRCKH